jgi:hypothetical protein
MRSGSSGASSPTRRSVPMLARQPGERTTAMFARSLPVALARLSVEALARLAGPRRLAVPAPVLALLLQSGLAACTGSPATLALRPDFEVMTPAGVASVGIRQSPSGMTDAEFAHLVSVGMARATPGAVIADRVQPPFPSQRIVWHVNPSASRGMSQLVVNVFNGANPYAYEQEAVTNDAPPAMITSAIESMSARLLADIVAQANTPDGSRTRFSRATANQTTLAGDR